MAVDPLWVRALDARRREQALTRSARWWAGVRRAQAEGRIGQGRRVHPVPKVGDVHGNVKIVALLPRKPADRRVRVECLTCGAQADAYMFNVRRGPKCARYGMRSHA